MSQTTRWTPKKDGELYRYIVDSRGRTIAHLPGATLSNHKARAWMIAKAPEMLTLVRAIAEHAGAMTQREIDLARALLADMSQKRYKITGTLNEEVQHLIDSARGDIYIDDDGCVVDPAPNGWLEDRLRGLVEMTP